MSNSEKFEQWCLVELFGRQRIAGFVCETTLAGGAFLQVEVPAVGEDPAHTRFYSPQAVYSINPVSEEVARAMAERLRERPVQAYELPQLQAPGALDDDSDVPFEGRSRGDDQEDGGEPW